MLVCGIPCLLAHPSEKEVSLPTLFPLPEPIVSAEEFCAEAAEAFGLTPREGETLLLVLENYDAHDIADEFGISPKTAKSYIRKVCRKVCLLYTSRAIRHADRERSVSPYRAPRATSIRPVQALS